MLAIPLLFLVFPNAAVATTSSEYAFSFGPIRAVEEEQKELEVKVLDHWEDFLEQEAGDTELIPGRIIDYWESLPEADQPDALAVGSETSPPSGDEGDTETTEVEPPHFEDNLLDNADFEQWTEEGRPESWQGSEDLSHNWWPDDEEALLGDYSVRVHGSGERILYQEVDLDGEFSTVAGKIWVAGTGSVELGLQLGDEETLWSSPLDLDRESWQEVENEATGAGEVEQITFKIRTYNTEEVFRALRLGVAWLGPAADGTEDAPYWITDWYDLDAIRDELEAHYVLVENLDQNSPGYDEIASADANEGAGWEPIGAIDFEEEDDDYDTPIFTPFNGGFDGQDLTISGLSVDRPDYVGAGLFTSIGESGQVANLNLIDVDITGYLASGPLAGASYGEVANVYASGAVYSDSVAGGLVGSNFKQEGDSGLITNSASEVEVSGLNEIGGLVGSNEGVIFESNATGDIIGHESANYIGGLVGLNDYGKVINSFAEGSVNGSEVVGGLVGSNKWGSIYNSYARGEVDGYEWVGGLAGENTSLISNSYAEGDVSGEHTIGGLVGLSEQEGEIFASHAAGNVTGGYEFIGGLVGKNCESLISNAYATGEVSSGYGEVGGLVGENSGFIEKTYAVGAVSAEEEGLAGGLIGSSFNGGEVDASFWDVETSGVEESAGGEGLTTFEMRLLTPYEDAGFDIVRTDAFENDGYPFFSGEPSPIWVIPEPSEDEVFTGKFMFVEMKLEDYTNPDERKITRESGEINLSTDGTFVYDSVYLSSDGSEAPDSDQGEYRIYPDNRLKILDSDHEVMEARISSDREMFLLTQTDEKADGVDHKFGLGLDASQPLIDVDDVEGDYAGSEMLFEYCPDYSFRDLSLKDEILEFEPHQDTGLLFSNVTDELFADGSIDSGPYELEYEVDELLKAYYVDQPQYEGATREKMFTPDRNLYLGGWGDYLEDNEFLIKQSLALGVAGCEMTEVDLAGQYEVHELSIYGLEFPGDFYDFGRSELIRGELQVDDAGNFNYDYEAVDNQGDTTLETFEQSFVHDFSNHFYIDGMEPSTEINSLRLSCSSEIIIWTRGWLEDPDEEYNSPRYQLGVGIRTVD